MSLLRFTPQPSRQQRPWLSLGSLGVATQIESAMKTLKISLAILLGVIGTVVAGFSILVVLTCLLAFSVRIPNFSTRFFIFAPAMIVGLLIIHFSRRLFVRSLPADGKHGFSLSLLFALLALAVPLVTLFDMFYEHAAFYWRYFHWSFIFDGGTSLFQLLLSNRNFSDDAAKVADIAALTPFGITIAFLTLSVIFKLYIRPPNARNA